MSGALLAAAAEPTFARHQTFHLRFGWLRKGFAAAEADSSVFSAEDATVRLGVGKNMVAAIRYWCTAYKVIEPQPTPNRPRTAQYVPTEFGRRLLDDSGWDPWLEDIGSLWLLHWKLLSPRSQAPVWWIAFNMVSAEQFDEQQLVDLVQELADAAGWKSVHRSSVKKDVDCMVRTFGTTRTGRQTLDDVLDSPTRQLGLILPAVGESKTWRFNTGPKPTLPATIAAYAALDFLASNREQESTISLARLANDPGSPGRVFRMTETALFDLLREASASTRGIRVVEPGGLRQLIVEGDVAGLRDQILSAHFSNTGALV